MQDMEIKSGIFPGKVIIVEHGKQSAILPFTFYVTLSRLSLSPLRTITARTWLGILRFAPPKNLHPKGMVMPKVWRMLYFGGNLCYPGLSKDDLAIKEKPFGIEFGMAGLKTIS